MATKIDTLTIVSQQGVKTYCVGGEYNGLILDRIEDWSNEFPDSLTIIFKGFTKDNELVFEAINCPVDVAYKAV